MNGLMKKNVIKHALMRIGLLVILICSGCATPVGVRSLGKNSAYDQIDRTALNSDAYSIFSENVLHRYSLKQLMSKSPTQCLITLHNQACIDNRIDPLFALAELSFLQGKKNKTCTINGVRLTAKNYYTAAAVYSHLFINSFAPESNQVAFDRRFRIACDIYNRSLANLVLHTDFSFEKPAHNIPLPVGCLNIKQGTSDLTKPLSSYAVIRPADRYEIYGLSIRTRLAGLGAPLVIVQDKKAAQGTVPVGEAATVFMRIHGDLNDFETNTLNGEVDIYSPSKTRQITVRGRTIPLEQDLTTPIAYTLNNPVYWQLQKTLFRLGHGAFKPDIYQSIPYTPGKIPILWVHGTRSSPVRWAEMWNTLMADQTLRENYQHWFLLYDSGKPIVQSIALLREKLTTLLNTLDPEQKDLALRQIVVIGHSQGGLLTKAIAVDTGDTLIEAATGKTLAELDLSPADERLLCSYAKFKPLPPVKRVVFISTPHRGSFLVNNLARRFGVWFIRLPKNVVQTTADLVRIVPQKNRNIQRVVTSLDSMAPDNPRLLALASLSVSPEIKAHSIIAIKPGQTAPKGHDGVVKYTSAHIDDVESERIVPSGHSCQGHPQTIEEVRRILLLHLEELKPH